MTEKFIVRPLNGPFFLYFGFIALIFLIFHIKARKMDMKKRSRILSIMMIITSIGFVAYKIALCIDPDYSSICVSAGIKPFNWWTELPFQLCNINMLMIPFALATGRRRLQGFSVFSGTLGALMALLMPSVGFENYSMFLPRMLGFFLTHWMVFFGSLSLLTLGFFKPSYKDIPSLLIIFFTICTIIFGFNMFLRSTGLAPGANYWYNVVTEGNPILELFHSFIPIPLLYTAPCLIILAVYMAIITAVSNMIDRIKQKKLAA